MFGCDSETSRGGQTYTYYRYVLYYVGYSVDVAALALRQG